MASTQQDNTPNASPAIVHPSEKNKQPTAEELQRLYGIKARDFAEQKSGSPCALLAPLLSQAKMSPPKRYGSGRNALKASLADFEEGGGTWMRNGVEVSIDELGADWFFS